MHDTRYNPLKAGLQSPPHPGEYGQGREGAWRCGAHSWEALAAAALFVKSIAFLVSPQLSLHSRLEWF